MTGTGGASKSSSYYLLLLFQNVHKLIRYLLTPSVSDRPDIYQTSELAFSLRNKKSPIQVSDGQSEAWQADQ